MTYFEKKLYEIHSDDANDSKINWLNEKYSKLKAFSNRKGMENFSTKEMTRNMPFWIKLEACVTKTSHERIQQ